MDKIDLSKFYCKECDTYYNEVSRENYSECPICHEEVEIKYFCPRCETFKDNIEYYPFAEGYMCDDCHNEMMDIGELVNEAMEGVINNEEQNGLFQE